MRILKYEILPKEKLFSHLRKVRLRGFDRPCIYKNANFNMFSMTDTNFLTPPQRYVLKENVETLVTLDRAFTEEGIDIFDLHGAIMFWPENLNPEKHLPIPLLPPIVEESQEPDGRTVMLINDGMHRVYTARKLGRFLNVVLVTHVPRQYPYYAYAIQEGWSGVTEIDELTDGFKRKEYRNPDNYKALFRDFNEVFPGVQVQRKQTQPHLKE